MPSSSPTTSPPARLNARQALPRTSGRNRPGGRFEFLAKILELFGAHIADGAQIETLLGPELDVHPLHGLDPCAVLRVGTLRNEQVYDVAASPVHDRRH